MSKLEKLIQELCPNGVIYTKLKDAVYFEGGYPLSAKSFSYTGLYNCIKISDISDNKIIESNNFINELPPGIKDSQLLHGNEILVGMSGSTGKCGFNYDIKEAIVNQRIGIIRNRQNILVGYLKHLLVNKNFTEYCFKNGTGPQNNISKETILRYEIPLPPLEVQQEIVRILDNFTELTTELATELTTELTARKQQYEYYRDKILAFDEDVDGITWKPLGELCTFIRGPFGSSLKKENFVSNGYAVYEQQNAIYNKFTFRYFITEEKFTELKRFEVSPDDLIMSCSGTMGKIAIIPENAPKGIINQALLKITAGPDIYNMYLKYCFESMIERWFNQSARGGAIKNVASVGELKQFCIPVPSLNIQKQIVKTLDQFYNLCNDLSNGLPAEIEARQKQYEYYRDKVLTFKKLA